MNDMRFHFDDLDMKAVDSVNHGREEEGGCGVVGFIASVPVSGKNIITPSIQMHNRGNGKGGGIAAVGLDPKSVGIGEEDLKTKYLLHIAYLDPMAQKELEEKYIKPHFDIYHSERLMTVDDFRDLDLEVKPPDVVRYLVRVKPKVLADYEAAFKEDKTYPFATEDDFVYKNSFAINHEFYASLGEKRAFVLSHGKNMMILKVVGYAEQVAQYYKLEDFKAHAWVAHQRYPTKGKVWHPGGAHPFSAMHEALIHNGDFANYHAIVEYLGQRGRHPLFLTDTESAALLFDLLNREYRYPTESLIEAIAPTSELDFKMLGEERQRRFKIIQEQHLHASPDGPWFFIVAKNDPGADVMQLIGITDTSMLRPQVFALSKGEVDIGLIASEKQAIDATLENLNLEDARFSKVADKYWNARGGSHSDGGSFIFTLKEGEGKKELTAHDKFSNEVILTDKRALKLKGDPKNRKDDGFEGAQADDLHAALDIFISKLKTGKDDEIASVFESVEKKAKASSTDFDWALSLLTLIIDRRYPTGPFKRSSIIEHATESLGRILSAVPPITEKGNGDKRIDWPLKDALRKKEKGEGRLIIDAKGFEPEGELCDAILIVRAHSLGWSDFVVYNARGQRFIGSGLGVESHGVKIDVFGSSGDYAASSMDGATVIIHGNAQDQLGQILKSGKLIIHGDVGQTFLYGAKGGEIYVLGNAAGRPLINGVGSPKVVINGTCLDYLAQSFMAGDPLKGGGFVTVNGLGFDDGGEVAPLDNPYPGGNIFSLASGGAVYIRDPHGKLTPSQLNGGKFEELTKEDFDLIYPYLKENERLFGIEVAKLFEVDGVSLEFDQVYRKIVPAQAAVLAALENGLEE